jgi:hypothetical protein
VVAWEAVVRLVDEVLAGSEVVVATLPDAPDLLGWMATGPDQVLEFLFLRQALADNGRDPDGRRYLGGAGPYGGRPGRWVPLPLALDVARALLVKTTAPILRRAPDDWMLAALAAAGYSPTIVPGAI